jgi:hypothetical protein
MQTASVRFAVPAETIDSAFYPRVPGLSLELTSICNLTCPYCANPSLTRPKGTIGWDLLERVVDECAATMICVSTGSMASASRCSGSA